MLPIVFEKDDVKKAVALKAFTADVFPVYLKHMESCLSANGGKHVVGDALTYADIVIAYGLGQLCKTTGDEWKKEYKVLAKFLEDTMAQPKIKAWMDSRPAGQ